MMQMMMIEQETRRKRGKIHRYSTFKWREGEERERDKI